MAEEKTAPSWAFESKSLDEYQEKEMINLERLNITPSQEVSEDVLAVECEQIEHCASSGKTYHYNASWSQVHVGHLKEYASICGITDDKFKGVDPKAVSKMRDEITAEANNSRNIRVASVNATETNKLDLGDPFHLDERSNTSHMESTKWQEVKKQAKMKEAPVMLNGNIIPIRGGEDYFTNSESKTAKNQNSITNPNAIKSFAENDEEDTGSTLKRLLKEKEEAKKLAHVSWQKEVVDSMEYKDIVAKGKVFPTESLNANPGLSTPSSKMGVYAKFDPESIPEKTAGEQIKQQNAEYRSSINSRSERSKYEFEASQQSSRAVTDVFAEELRKRLK